MRLFTQSCEKQTHTKERERDKMNNICMKMKSIRQIITEHVAIPMTVEHFWLFVFRHSAN